MKNLKPIFALQILLSMTTTYASDEPLKYYDPTTGNRCISEYERALGLAKAYFHLDSAQNLDLSDFTRVLSGTPPEGTYWIRYHTWSGCRNVGGRGQYRTCDGVAFVSRDFALLAQQSSPITCTDQKLDWSCEEEDARNSNNNGYGQ